MNANAFLDALYLTEKLSERYNDAAVSEVHLFAYLGCLLALYDGKRVEFWEYIFIVGKANAPYAGELADAMDALVENGLVSITESETDKFIKITKEGVKELDTFSRQEMHKPRFEYLKIACETILLVNLTDIRGALRKEPAIAHAVRKQAKKSLIDNHNPSLAILYDQFDSLKIALQEKFSDLLIPAITWLQFVK